MIFFCFPSKYLDPLNIRCPGHQFDLGLRAYLPLPSVHRKGVLPRYMLRFKTLLQTFSSLIDVFVDTKDIYIYIYYIHMHISE